MPATRVLVLYNEPTLATDHPEYEAEADVLHTVDAVSSALAADFAVSRLGINTDPQALLDGLRIHQPNVVFNLFEGTAGHNGTEAHVAGILDWLRIPLTGSPYVAICVAQKKHLAKHLLRGAGLPTADFFVVEHLPVPVCPLAWPVMVKPAAQDASVGVDQASVVTEQDALDARVAQLLRSYGPPVLVEEFLSGRELNVAVIESPELRTLPPSEILFLDPGVWPIVTYDAKWKPHSRACLLTPPRYPAEVEPALAERLSEAAQQAFVLLGCRDYARVDFRLSASGKPCILEVNPNPDFNPSAGLTAGLASIGISHAEFSVRLVHSALARGSGVTD